MTLDDAIAELATNWHDCRDAHGLLIALERIGAVKFDKPLSVPERIRRVVEDPATAQGDTLSRMDGLLSALKANGLKIVEGK